MSPTFLHVASHRRRLASHLILIVAVALIVIGVSCSFAGGAQHAEDAEPQADASLITEAPGTVTKVGNIGFGLVPDSDPGTRYAPVEELPEAFRQDGLRVRFSGELTDPSDARRRWGTPLRVTAIERLDNGSPGDAQG